MPEAGRSITRVLALMSDGDPDAKRQVLEYFYHPMRQIARVLLRLDAGRFSMESRDLLHLTIVSKLERDISSVRDQGHFLALTRLRMKQILIDRARRRSSRDAYQKLQQTAKAYDNDFVVDRELEIAVSNGLNKLKAIDPQLAKIVTSRIVDSCTWEQVAERAGVSVRKARDEYSFGISWLRQQLRSKLT